MFCSLSCVGLVVMGEPPRVGMALVQQLLLRLHTRGALPHVLHTLLCSTHSFFISKPPQFNFDFIA